MRLDRALLAILLTRALLDGSPARAQEGPAAFPGQRAESPEEPASPAPPEVPAAQRSPRAVLETFFARMREDKKKEAAELLDLSELAAIAAESRGPDLAYKLYSVLPALGQPPRSDPQQSEAPRVGEIGDGGLDFSTVSDDPGFDGPWRLSTWLEFPAETAAQVTIDRDPEGAWRFSAETVAQIDALYEVAEARIEQIAQERAADPAAAATVDQAEPTETFAVSVRRLFPRALRTTHFVLPTYQWVLLLLWLPVGRLIDQVTRRVLTWIGDRVLRRIDPDFEEAHETTAPVWRPVGRLAMASSWVAVAFTTDLPVGVTNVLLTALMFVAIVAAVLAAFRVLDLVAGYFSRRAKRSQHKFDDLVVPLAATTAKLVAVLVGVVAAVATQNDELPATVLGGLGIGGVAIALASQETLSNFIGSVMLLFDRPFEVGDWVRIDNIEGEVESLGFRSTKLRTGLNSQVSVPNSTLAAANVDNLGRRKYRRYLNKLGLEYGTPIDRIEAFCEGIRELVRRHPHTRKDFYAAYFNDFGPSSLDVLVVVYFQAPDWATELRERHRLLADIARLADSLGVAFAFPTQTLHLHRGETSQPPGRLAEEDAVLAGVRAAADIAGELPNYQDRPGKVKFPGPTPLSR